MKVYFPTYKKLPHDRGLNEDYYNLDVRSGIYKPGRHWCYIAEIIRDDTLVSPMFLVKDKDGHESRVAFHFEGRTGPMVRVRIPELEPLSAPSFNKVPCKVGNTICIMYAHQHNFLDCTHGIRVEERDSVSVSPWSANLGGSFSQAAPTTGSTMYIGSVA